jgi:uncharacterized protein (TIGR01777 family)
MFKSVLIAGGSGFIGRKLGIVMKERGYKVYKLSRRKSNRSSYIEWNPELNTIDTKKLSKINIIVNLVGANIGQKRWTEARKKELIASRVNTTKFLRTVAEQMPNLVYYVSVSGINCYGPESDKVHQESDAFGDDFLSQLVKEWEEASDSFSDLCPVAKLRSGVVLAKNGGILKKILFPFRFGLGSAFGTGRQHVPWIHLDDLCRIFSLAIQYKWEGVFNAIAACTSNKEFSRAIARALRRPFILPNIPSKLLYFLLGERAILLVGGTKASNQKLLGAGFNFQHKTIDSTMRHILRK